MMVHDEVIVTVDVATWTTQDGRVFKIVDMDDKHLFNTVRFLMAKLSVMALANSAKTDFGRLHRKKREAILTAKLDALKAEANRRGLHPEVVS